MAASFTSQDFMQTLAQYLGISEADLAEGGNLLDTLAPIKSEEDIKSELRAEYRDVLGSLQEQTKGYSAGVKEAMSSQQRQQLAESARQTGSSQRMLSGRSKGAAVIQAQQRNLMQQAGVVQNVAQEEKAFTQSAKEQLQGLETSLARAAQSQVDADRDRRIKVGMNLFQLAELARQKTEQNTP